MDNKPPFIGAGASLQSRVLRIRLGHCQHIVAGRFSSCVG